MEKRFKDESVLKEIDIEKRAFLKKVVVGTAFAVPVINSFSMEGLKVDLAQADEFDKPGSFDNVGPGGSGSRGGLGGVTSG